MLTVARRWQSGPAMLTIADPLHSRKPYLQSGLAMLTGARRWQSGPAMLTIAVQVLPRKPQLVPVFAITTTTSSSRLR